MIEELAPSMLVRSPKPIVCLILDGTAVLVWVDRIHRVDPGVPNVLGSASSPPHEARIGLDARIHAL